MKKDIYSECESCTIRGYSPELCKMHLQHVAKEKNIAKPTSPLKNLGGAAAIGAGVGVTGCLAGMAIAPALGAKAILGHLVAVKVAGAGGAVGAGANVALNKKKKPKSKLIAKR